MAPSIRPFYFADGQWWRIAIIDDVTGGGGGGDGIQFDTDNEGGYLDVTANDFGPVDAETGDLPGVSFKSNAGGLLLRVGTNWFYIDAGGNARYVGASFVINTAAGVDIIPSGDLRIITDADLTFQVQGASTIDYTGYVAESMGDDRDVFIATAGKTLTIRDADFNPLVTYTG